MLTIKCRKMFIYLFFNVYMHNQYFFVLSLCYILNDERMINYFHYLKIVQPNKDSNFSKNLLMTQYIFVMA